MPPHMVRQQPSCTEQRTRLSLFFCVSCVCVVWRDMEGVLERDAFVSARTALAYLRIEAGARVFNGFLRLGRSCVGSI
jgi:hypothetical protein